VLERLGQSADFSTIARAASIETASGLEGIGARETGPAPQPPPVRIVRRLVARMSEPSLDITDIQEEILDDPGE
jgi:hypothetical protein